jgi:hypothetical protein
MVIRWKVTCFAFLKNESGRQMSWKKGPITSQAAKCPAKKTNNESGRQMSCKKGPIASQAAKCPGKKGPMKNKYSILKTGSCCGKTELNICFGMPIHMGAATLSALTTGWSYRFFRYLSLRVLSSVNTIITPVKLI